jgi:IS30 family transposase
MKKQLRKRAKSRTFSRVTYKERVTIENRYCIDQKTVTEIASELRRPKSSISREIDGAPRKGRHRYSADRAQARADENSARQGRGTKLIYDPLRAYVTEKLKLGWSPEQVAIRLPLEYPKDSHMRISYEAIYQYIYAQVNAGGTIKKGKEDLRPHLTRRHKRRQHKGFRQAQKLYRPALPSIDDRPKRVNTRTEVGDWEDDSMISRESAYRVKSMNERVSGVFFFEKVVDGSSAESNRAVIKRLSSLPKEVRRTLTRDRGTENMGWEALQRELEVTCWFAHPYCSQERGSNENGNGLFRRFFPKKTDFANVSDADIKRAEYLLNSRPRKRLGGRTPYEVFFVLTGVALDS